MPVGLPLRSFVARGTCFGTRARLIPSTSPTCFCVFATFDLPVVPQFAGGQRSRDDREGSREDRDGMLTRGTRSARRDWAGLRGVARNETADREMSAEESQTMLISRS